MLKKKEKLNAPESPNIKRSAKVLKIKIYIPSDFFLTTINIKLHTAVHKKN